jgi:hypothetical protein
VTDLNTALELPSAFLLLLSKALGLTQVGEGVSGIKLERDEADGESCFICLNEEKLAYRLL